MIYRRVVACSRGAFALVYRTSQPRILVLPVALGLSACQTIDDAPASAAWNSVPAMRASEGQSRPARLSGAPLLANTRGGQSTVIEGSGRFVGEPPTGAINPSSEDVTDGVTLNLVNVPSPQAAKTILGDILSVKYTVDPASRARSRFKPQNRWRDRRSSICSNRRCDPTTLPSSIPTACIGSSPPIRPSSAPA